MFTRIYALLICFVTMICITITTGVGLYQLVKIAAPELTLSPYRYQHLQTNESYRRSHYSGNTAIALNPDFKRQLMMPQNKFQEMDDAELTTIRERELDAVISSSRKESVASLIRIIIILLVSVPVFFVHWRMSQRLEAETAPKTPD